ncbi:MAG: hypothetical protein IT319_00270 [Anaerolineae bacterium]|nr:hypothetical protein [Anaerolineae bacterium]
MSDYTLQHLHDFIVRAKAATYVGGGQHAPSHRPGSVDLEFHAAPFAYLDSYFGGSDFIGQEVVYHDAQPVWAMNYYGYILRPDLIDAALAGSVIKRSLSELYREGRFLGGFVHPVESYTYTDTNSGDVAHFHGKEWITCRGIRVYALTYHGGLIKG